MRPLSRGTGRTRRELRGVVTVLVIAMMIIPLSPVRAEVAGRQAGQRLKSAYQSLRDIKLSLSKENLTPVKPQAVEESSQRAARVTRVQLCPRRLLLYVGEEYALSPLPLDEHGEPVHGVIYTWETSDVTVADVASNGIVTAVKSGQCFITASVGNRREKVLVQVREGQKPFLTTTAWDAEHAQDCENPEQSPGEPGDKAASSLKIDSPSAQHGSITPSVIEDEDPPGISQGGSAGNATGHPRFAPNLVLQSNVASTDNNLGSHNFNFAIPIYSLSGRGLGVNLELSYNSRMWTKNDNKMVFDYDQGWPAPGFRLNYGRIILNFDSIGNHLLIQPDGTRIPLIKISEGSQIFRSQDGQHIEFDLSSPNVKKLTYPGGTVVKYTENGSKLMPQTIEDVNGNSFVITYVLDCEDTPRIGGQSCTCGTSGCKRAPRQAIKHIRDTLNRLITFHYYADGNLAEIRVPGYNDGPSRTLVKFYYGTVTMSYNFGSLEVVKAPANGQSLEVLRKVYFPDTHRGYIFSDYSGYGMFKKASSNAAMTETLDGTPVSHTEYVFETSAPFQESPGFTQRKDWWQGKTDDQGNLTTLPTTFDYTRTTDTVAKTMTNTVTRQNQAQTVMVSNNDSASSQYGVVKTQKVINPTTGSTLFQQDYTYSNSSGIGGLQRTQVDTIPDNISANQTRVELSYGTFGRLTSQVEYGFRDNGSFKRRRRTDYIYFSGGTSYTDKGLLRLVESVRVYDLKLNGDPADDELLSRTDYAYDENSDPNWSLQKYGFTNNCAPPACPAPPGYATNTVDRSARGNITTVKMWSAASLTNPPDITFRHRYDIFGNEVKAEIGCCSLRQYTFSPEIAGRYFSKALSVADGPATGPTLTTTYDYDFNTGFLKSVTDPQNRLTSYAPDAAMRLMTTTLPKLASDSNPNPKIETLYPPDPNYGNQEGLIIQQRVTYMEGATQKVIITNKWIDGAGRVLRAGTGAGPSPSSFDAVKSIYDDLGRLRKTTNPYSTTSPNGDTSGLPNPTVYDYDSMGRVKLVTLPGGSGNTVQTEYSGAETTIIDQVGRKRKNLVDGLGRMVTVTEQNPTNGNLEWSTNYTYDLLDNLIGVNQNNQTRTYEYDSMSRMKKETTPEAGMTTYTYTSFNAILKRTDARGVETHYRYDGLNRLDQVSYTGPSGGPVPPPVEATATVNINYNNLTGQVAGNGLVSFITDGAGREDYVYDGLSRVLSRTRLIDSNSYPVGYEYNQAGHFTAVVYPSGKRVRMNHDQRGRMIGIDRVDTSGSVLTTYLSNVGYNPTGLINTQTIGDVIVESFGYNNRLQLASRTATKVGGPANGLMNLTYNYEGLQGRSGFGTTPGNSGQLLDITGTINGAVRNEVYGYDNVGRLTIASGWWPGSQINYTYDRWGNRTAMSGAQSQTVSMQQMQGAPAGVTNNRIALVGLTAYEYDAAGNLTSDNGVINRYRYDGENRLVKADGSNVVYTYDSTNRRVKKLASGVTTYYVWEGSQVIAEYRTSPTAGGGLRYHLADMLSTRLTTNSAGDVVGTQDHYPFGVDVSATGVVEKHRFTGYERDTEIGSDYAINRQYSNLTGRFMRPDPIRGSINNPQSLNRYSYVWNDPIAFTDPTGLYTTCAAQYRTCPGGGGGYPDIWSWGFGRSGSESAAAERLWNWRLHNTLDAVAAKRALAAGNFGKLADILNSNENVGLSVGGLTLWGALGGAFATGYGQPVLLASAQATPPRNINFERFRLGLSYVINLLKKLRGPDFFIANIANPVQLSVAIPRGGGWDDRIVSLGLATGVEASVFAGWLLQMNEPSQDEITNFLSGWSVSVDVFLFPKVGKGLGGGVMAANGDSTKLALLIGLGIGGGIGWGWGDYRDLLK
ncbi:MAG TPA: RHS repeat-associated core domain-containing protein [Blastocatellia bacterium]|nr:RHS repeat-associated core domain-containing protein [Blastocatellia bacterium]